MSTGGSKTANCPEDPACLLPRGRPPRGLWVSSFLHAQMIVTLTSVFEERIVTIYNDCDLGVLR